MNSTEPAAALPPPKPRRWPLALLVGLITGVVGAGVIAPIADWVMKMHHVSNMEGGRGCAVIILWMPLAFIAGFVAGFAVSFAFKRAGFVGYLIRQGAALVIIALLIAAAAGIGYATADHPPLIDGKNLALEMEIRVPTKGRSIEELKAASFEVALVVSVSDRSYSDLRWNEATRTEEFITVPAWASLNSRNAGREITAGIRDENRQVFNVLRVASPKTDDAWSEWAAPRERFDGSKPAPADQYFARYRVRFAAEYSPTPAPTATPDDSPVPEETPEDSPQSDEPTPGGSP